MAIDIITKFYEQYGARAKQASQNKGVDWKAISHALRAGYQVEQLMNEGTITFPLKQAEFLRAVKLGEFEFKNIITILEDLIDDVDRLSNASDLPDKVFEKPWREWVVKTNAEHIGICDRKLDGCVYDGDN